MTTPETTQQTPITYADAGVDIDAGTLRLALTHRSYAYENGGLPTNERLEFLGDSVLGIIVTEYLYRTHPEVPEGQLAKMRAATVSEPALAAVARDLGLGEFIKLGKGEALSGGRDKDSILSDTVEALIGATYLTHGLETARGLIEKIIGDRLTVVPHLGAALDWKTSLQEKCASLGRPKARYEITSTGPDHDKTFAAVVFVGDDSPGRHDDDAVGQTGGLLERVRRDHGGAAPVGRGADEVPHVPAGVGIEPGGRLVEEGDLGVAEEGGCQGHPLALASAQAADRCPGEGGDVESLDELRTAVGPVEPAEVGEQAAGRDALRQPAVLEHDAHPRTMVGVGAPRVGPEHAHLAKSGRAQYVPVTDEAALRGFALLSRLEGIIPALEPSHAIAAVARHARTMRRDQVILANLCGRGDKDIFTVARHLGVAIEG